MKLTKLLGLVSGLMISHSIFADDCMNPSVQFIDAYPGTVYEYDVKQTVSVPLQSVSNCQLEYKFTNVYLDSGRTSSGSWQTLADETQWLTFFTEAGNVRVEVLARNIENPKFIAMDSINVKVSNPGQIPFPGPLNPLVY